MSRCFWTDLARDRCLLFLSTMRWEPEWDLLERSCIRSRTSKNLPAYVLVYTIEWPNNVAISNDTFAVFPVIWCPFLMIPFFSQKNIQFSIPICPLMTITPRRNCCSNVFQFLFEPKGKWKDEERFVVCVFYLHWSVWMWYSDDDESRTRMYSHAGFIAMTEMNRE